jgi:hypothetical protein
MSKRLLIVLCCGYFWSNVFMVGPSVNLRQPAAESPRKRRFCL